MMKICKESWVLGDEILCGAGWLCNVRGLEKRVLFLYIQLEGPSAVNSGVFEFEILFVRQLVGKI